MEQSSVCVVDGDGRLVREAKVLIEPDALISWFSELGLQLERIGLEAGPLSQWLHAAMKNAGLAVELIEPLRGIDRADDAASAPHRDRQRSR